MHPMPSVPFFVPTAALVSFWITGCVFAQQSKPARNKGPLKVFILPGRDR